MGQMKSKVIPEDGNLENDEIIQKRQRFSLLRRKKSPSKDDIVPQPLSSPALSFFLPTSTEGVNQSVDEVEERKCETLEQSKYAVDYNHVHEKIAEFTDAINPTDEHSALKLMDIFAKMNISQAELDMWVGDYGSRLRNKADATSKLRSVVEFADTNSSCTPAVKTQLRVITKLVMEAKDKSDFHGVLLLLASHGNVCNVMKEVAIKDAYHALMGGFQEYAKAQTLKEQVLRLLRDHRCMLVETLFHSFKFTNNTHYIAGFHNTIAEQIGVPPYNDPDICYPSNSNHPKWRENLDKKYFAEHYTLEHIMKFVMTQIEEKRIGYQKVVAWFEEHCPKDMKKTQFLSAVIDVNNGNIDSKWMCWMLHKMGVFLVKDDDWKPIEKCWPN